MADNGRIGGRVIELGSVDSTNKHAAELLAGGKIGHGTVIVAHEQTAGRGQRGRNWFAMRGLDLTASVVLCPADLVVADQPALSKAMALAVHDVVSGVLAEAGRDPGRVRVKWPNDVLVDRRKIAGILIESTVRGARVGASVVGVGLNVNSTDLDIGLQATSLLLETGAMDRVDRVLERLCRAMETRWSELVSAPADLGAPYGALLWGRGRFMVFDLDGQPFTGRPLEVDAFGRLVVEDAFGRVEAYGTDRLRFAAR